jgi:DNA-binding transcriptional ArsR family regulator
MLPNVAKVASLIGDSVRSKMLFALLDGRELAASELAFRGESSPQAASAHLAKLVEGGLIVARTSGRQRLFRLASGEIAHAIEVLASIAPVAPVVSLNQHTAMRRLRIARSCYDHLAGRLGVGVTDALIDRGVVVPHGDLYDVSAQGNRFLSRLGIDVDAARASRRHFARRCLDWTERRPHIAGALGAAILTRFLAERWVRRNGRDRSLALTEAGTEALKSRFGLHLE